MTVYNSDGTTTTMAVVPQIKPIDTGQGSGAASQGADEILVADQGLHPWLATMSNSSFYDVYDHTVTSWMAARSAFKNSNPGYTYSLQDDKMALAVNLEFNGFFAQGVYLTPRLPDFATAGGNISIPFTDGHLGVHVGVTGDRYGTNYGSLGLAVDPTGQVAGGSLTGGWMVAGPTANGQWRSYVTQTPTQQQLSSMITGPGGSVSGFGGPYFVGGGLSGNNSGAAVNLGVGTPGVSADATETLTFT